ncbi:MAG: 1-deoxy-D-xylulose-5-phosphate reductoisomerase, partial [Victivallales bacterium]|nr:1-deoxy-D-xylulose-5-phosphate reductoisomerase [Victivallales bacterium]
MKNVAVLGSTGSIGTNTLKVLRNNGERFHAIGLAAGRNVQRLAEQAEEFRPSWVYAEGDVSSQRLPDGTHIIHSQDELCEAVAAKDVDIVLCAISGTAGLKPVLAAIQAGKDIALASKEVLVMAGAIVTEACKKSGSKLLPVDSEHCAIFQCIDQHPADSVSRV